MNGWEEHYAILMPNGELFSAQAVQTETDYSADSSMSGFFSMFGMSQPTVSRPVGPPRPVVFFKRADAEKQLKSMREQAAQFGVTHWGGEIVHRVCTPFTAGQLAGRQFEDALQRWLADNILLNRPGCEDTE